MRKPKRQPGPRLVVKVTDLDGTFQSSLRIYVDACQPAIDIVHYIRCQDFPRLNGVTAGIVTLWGLPAGHLTCFTMADDDRRRELKRALGGLDFSRRCRSSSA